jgi:hypothetical protein
MARRGTKTAGTWTGSGRGPGNGDENGDDKVAHIENRLVVEKGTGAHFVATTQDNGLVALVPVVLKTAEQYADGFKDVE